MTSPTNNLQIPLEKLNDEDSIISNSTSISTTETIIQDVLKNKNIYLITKNIEQRIIEILSYLQSDSNFANNKIHIVKYLQSLFMNVEFNSEIFLRKFIKEKEKINLYKIIINQYIFYTNPGNKPEEEENYRSDLQTLFLLLLSQVTLEKDSYHYILSPLINYLNEKNISNTKKKNLSGNNFLENEPVINLKSEHIKRILILLKYFYGYYKNEQSCNGILNYFFFNGDSQSYITIPNKENPLDSNKKLLNLDETLCVMIFIKVLPSEYIKAVYNKITFKLFELIFNDNDKTIHIKININSDNQLIAPPNNDPLFQLLENETNCLVFKFNKKKTTINGEIQIGFQKVGLPPIQLESGKGKNSKIKEEIKEIILFKNFIGTCSNIIIYKEKKSEGLPDFLFDNNIKLRLSSKDINERDSLRKSSFCLNSLFPNGIYNEELYSYFSNAELGEQNNNFKDFFNNNLISIYIPNRYQIPNQNEEKTISNTSNLILIDSINGLNAEFITRSPALNGIHIFQNLYEDDLSILGGLNNFLPILELILDNNDFLNLDIFSSFFDLLTVYVFSPKYQNALIKEDKSNFFKCLSFFLERIPDNFFNNELAENFKTILGFLCPPNGENNFNELVSQFHDYILMNEKILLKFNEENQKNLIHQMSFTAGRKNVNIDIIKIIRIMFNYDINRKYMFCCKEHSKYFNDENYAIMEPELSNRLEPIMQLLEIIFEKTYKINMKKYEENINSNNINNTKNKIRKKNSITVLKANEEPVNIFDDKNFYLLFYFLTYDISPCLQEGIIGLLANLIKKHTYNKFGMVFDKKKELIDIILFVFKTSIFDIKIKALNLILRIDKENNWNYMEKNDIKTFIQNEILPIFLLDDINDLTPKNNMNDNNKININAEDKNEIILEENTLNNNKEEKEENVDINKIKNEFIEKSQIREEIKEKNNEIKKEIEINGVIYKLFSSTKIEKKVYQKYNKKKYKNLVFNLFLKIFEHFDDPEKVFNLIIKTVSNGDLFLVSSFISKLVGMVQDTEISKKKNLCYQIVKNKYFLQFILDTYLQFYILENNKDSNKTFISGFSLEIYKNQNTSENKEIPYGENDKKDMIKKTLKDCEKILNFILNEDITKIDYLLTWGKYYEELKEENNIYQYAHELISSVILDFQVAGKNILTFSETSNLDDLKVKSTLYFLNIYFEFFTYYNLKYDENIFKDESKVINKIIKDELKYILFNITQEKFEPNPINELKPVDQKIKNNSYLQIIISIVNPIWTGSEKKLLKNENDVYASYINEHINKNIFNNELKLLFDTFDDNFFGNNKNETSNTGMRIIIILYNFFICFLNVGGTIRELKDYLKDFRLFLLLLITSPSSINIDETIKKKKWPNLEQYEYIRGIIEAILFNAIFFFYNKIKDYKKQEREFNYKLEMGEGKEDEKIIENYKTNLECISSLKKLYSENLGYILKILNKVYRGVKKDESQNNGFMHYFSSKSKTAERVKKTGGFSLINEIYEVCFNKSNIKDKKAESNRKYTMDEKDNSEQSNNNINNTPPQKQEKFERRMFKSYTTKDIRILTSDLTSNDDNMKKLEKKHESEKDMNNNILNLQENLNLSGNSDFSSNENNNNTEDNYLDNISKINFCPKDTNEISLSDNDYILLDNYLDSFLEDENILYYYNKHYEERISNLFSFTSTIIKRHENMKKIIPIYNNIKNLSNYSDNLCLMPYYYQESEYEKILQEKIKNMNQNLREEIKISQKIMEIEDWSKEEEYRNCKKNLFKFRRIWSNEDYFYDLKKYKLKYKIMNHFTNDLTKIFMTPITDIDYYLPKFSKFNDEIFRSELNEIPVTKVTDISLTKIKKINSKENQKEINEENRIINPIYELNEEYYSFLKEIEKKEGEETLVNNNFNQKDFEIFSKYIYNKHLNIKGKVLQCEACLVKLPFHIRGIIYINNSEIGFYSYETKRTNEDEDYDVDKKVCFGSVFQEKSEKYKHYCIQIPFNKMEFIFRRRYYFKKNVIEIYTQDKKSYFFRIDENKFNEFFDYIISNKALPKFNNEFEDITIENGKNEEKIGLINKSNILFEYNNYKTLFFGKKLSTIKNLYIKWIKWEISTFTLLNYLNLFSSRSYNDINQYPVFPWIITFYTKTSIPELSYDNLENQIIRPFNKPMGMMDITKEAEERKNNYLFIFDSDEKDKEENEDRYGSHYSTSLYLTYYLVRVFPFSYLRIEIQGKNFDDPNRLFNSLSNSFECAITQKSDLRELIPEFFCFPEMFYNNNDLNLGEILDENTKQNKLVNEITMPPWSSNDAYIFIKYHREFLESIEISEKIHEWFNIIFGSKQKGKEAKKIHNLFIKQTYDDFDEIHNKSSLSEKIYQNRMVEFGVTPSQIFRYDVDKRFSVKALGKKPIMYDYHMKKAKEKENIFNIENEILIRESELYVEGNPYKIFSSWKKTNEEKNEKILILYKDKVKIISKIEKDFFKKSKYNSSSRLNTLKIKEKEKLTPKKEEGENEEDNKETKEEIIIEEVAETNEENNEINLSKDISKYDKKIFCPKYRMDIDQSPSLIYDKGNYLMLGGFWNGEIFVNKIEDNEKNKKNKVQKNYNIISTNKMSPITIMKMDESETFLLCANKIGCIFIYSNNKENKLEWNLIKAIHDNQKEITSLDLNENLNVFITSDKEGYNNLYTFPQCKLFNSYKINENQLPTINIFNNNSHNNSSSVSRSESTLNISTSQNDLYVDTAIISQSPLPSIIFYFHSKKCLCVFSINFHFINAKYGFELVPNGIKKYSDYFRKDFLFIYNKRERTIDIYDIINLEIILRTSKIGYTFVDFCFIKEMENILIMVKVDEDDTKENIKDKKIKNNYKILMLNMQGSKDNRTS